MQQQTYRKLDLDLPTQEPVPQKPWIVGGWLLLFFFLLVVLLAYIIHKPVASKTADSNKTSFQFK